jgi:hypothetical protein
VHPISRFIYGMNGWDPSGRPKNLTLSRSGGNRMTAYNWETNASNAGSDYQNQNDDFLGGGNTPNGAVAPGLEAARAAGAAMIVTMPLIGYVAADKNGGGDVAGTALNPAPNYLATRFKQSLPRKGSAFASTPDTTDAFVYQDEYVHFLGDKYPGGFAATINPIWISLDNEPDLWQHTHARLRGDSTTFDTSQQHGTTATYAEMIQRTTDYADAAKDVNPDALIFGPVNYGWQGMIRFQDAADANNRDFLEFYLAQMKNAATTYRSPPGRRARRALVPGSTRHLRREPDGRLPHHRGRHRRRRGRRAQAGAAQPLGPGLHREQLDRAVQHQRADPPAAAPRGQDRR